MQAILDRINLYAKKVGPGDKIVKTKTFPMFANLDDQQLFIGGQQTGCAIQRPSEGGNNSEYRQVERSRGCEDSEISLRTMIRVFCFVVSLVLTHGCKT